MIATGRHMSCPSRKHSVQKQTSTLRQELTSDLSQKQTSVMSKQKTPVLSQQQTSWDGTKIISTPFFVAATFKMASIRRCPEEPDGMVAEMLKQNPTNHARWAGLRQSNKLPRIIHFAISIVGNLPPMFSIAIAQLCWIH